MIAFSYSDPYHTDEVVVTIDSRYTVAEYKLTVSWK